MVTRNVMFCITLLVSCLTLMPLVSSSQLYAQGGPSPEQPAKKVVTAGFVDFYYSNNFAKPSSRLNKLRNFDTEEDQFNISLAELVFEQSDEPVGFRIDADFGPTNDLVHAGNNGTFNYLQQAYITALLPIGKGLTINAGKFVTHMGYEVIESKDNWNYSRSFLFAWAIPYFHVGFRASYPLLDNLTVTGHVYNGWNRASDNNTAKTAGVAISYTPMSSLTMIENWIGGAEQDQGSGKRNVFDFIVTYQLSKPLALGLNVDFGAERFADSGLMIWKGAALYGKYSINEKTYVAARAEVFSDPNGHTTGTPQELKEVTTTFEHKFADALLFRLEYRHDWSTVEMFDSNSSVNSQKHQDTIVLATVIVF